MTDQLNEIFELQRALQERLGNKPESLLYNQGLITVNSIALIDEVIEALRETPWKPWKRNQQLNPDRFREEIVDAWHFLINLSLCAGFDADTLAAAFKNKNVVNHKRQDKGY